jgi:hypothetical protein
MFMPARFIDFLCCRRDTIDRLRIGEPHQLNLWTIESMGSRCTRAWPQAEKNN